MDTEKPDTPQWEGPLVTIPLGALQHVLIAAEEGLDARGSEHDSLSSRSSGEDLAAELKEAIDVEEAAIKEIRKYVTDQTRPKEFTLPDGRVISKHGWHRAPSELPAGVVASEVTVQDVNTQNPLGVIVHIKRCYTGKCAEMPLKEFLRDYYNCTFVRYVKDVLTWEEFVEFAEKVPQWRVLSTHGRTLSMEGTACKAVRFGTVLVFKTVPTGLTWSAIKYEGFSKLLLSNNGKTICADNEPTVEFTACSMQPEYLSTLITSQN